MQTGTRWRRRRRRKVEEWMGVGPVWGVGRRNITTKSEEEQEKKKK